MYINDPDSPFRVDQDIEGRRIPSVLTKLKQALGDDGAMQIFCHTLQHDGGEKMDGVDVAVSGQKSDWTGHVCDYIDCKDPTLSVLKKMGRTEGLQVLSKEHSNWREHWNGVISDDMRLLINNAKLYDGHDERKAKYPYIFQTFNLKRFNIKRDANQFESPNSNELKKCLLNRILKPTEADWHEELGCKDTTFTGGRAITPYPNRGQKCTLTHVAQDKVEGMTIKATGYDKITNQINNLPRLCHFHHVPQFGNWQLVWQFPPNYM